jgi:CRP/FNR family transcriptional regulator/CRP/FNR family cyclic AMP-dependent transcriptional regulator
VLAGSPRSATVKADEPSEYLRIGAKPFLECMRSDSAFAVKVAKHVASTLRRTNEQLRVIATLPAKHRVVWCLSVLARERAQRHDGDFVMEHHPLHRDIGNMTGLSRETATRELRDLENESCVTRAGDRLMIHRRAINRYLDQWPWLADPNL